MKILPVKLFSVENRNVYSDNNIMNNPYGNIYLNKSQDKFEISFNGLFENSTEPVRLDQAQHISGIHCPGCGIRMISVEDYEKLLKKAGEAENAGELIDLIKENQKFMPKHLRQPILKDSEFYPPEKTVKEYYKGMGDSSYLYKRAFIHKMRDDLKEYSDWFRLPPERNEKVHAIVDKIHTNQKYSIYKDAVCEYIEYLDLPDDKVNEIKMKTLKPAVLVNDYFRIFHSIKPNQMTEGEVAQHIIKSIFSKSVGNINTIDKFPQHEGLSNNKVLICGNCYLAQSKSNFLHNTADPENKNHIDSYLSDIAYLIGHDKIEDSKDYIQAFCLNMNKISRGRVFFTDNEIKSLRNLQMSASRHEIFAPIQQSKVDIPCAECGSIMLTHEMRKHIEEEMRGCKTLEDYAKILEKYDKYISIYARTYAEMFKGLVYHNPDMSKEEFLTRYKKKADKYTHGKFMKLLESYSQYRDYYVKNGTMEQLRKYDQFRKLAKEYIQSRSYLDDEMQSYYDKCINPINLDESPVKAIYIFNTSVKKYIQAHRITTSENKLSQRDEDPLYTIVFNIFKMGVATADHLVATSKGGVETKDNLIGLCKTCNKIKSQKDVKTWIIDNNRVKYNIEEQMEIIDKMAKEGQIEGFDNWAHNIAQNLYNLSEHKIDLRDKFEK